MGNPARFKARSTSVLPAPEAGVAPPTMSIRVVSRLTGVPAHTLRVWERRYGFPKPKRGDGGGRFYGESDVATLRLIRCALSAGYRAGDVVRTPAADLERLLEGTATKAPSFVGPSMVDTPPEQIVAAARAYRCDAVGIAIMPPADLQKVAAQLQWMLTELPRRVPIWAGGAGAWMLDLDAEGLVIVRDWAGLDESIQRLRR